ncbi:MULTISPECIES: hypothetical protein [unclassified Agromyces]|uniref:hypothetical protein n=1 Tax=unclassified Agromyces TaxID=2639701 RepID=UPI00301552F6
MHALWSGRRHLVLFDDGRTRTRDILDPTVSIDHDMVDAAPAARFTTHLRPLIDAGYGLPTNGEAVPDTAETASGRVAPGRADRI